MEKTELASEIRQSVEKLNSLIEIAESLNIKVFVSQNHINLSGNKLNDMVTVSLSITEKL